MKPLLYVGVFCIAFVLVSCRDDTLRFRSQRKEDNGQGVKKANDVPQEPKLSPKKQESPNKGAFDEIDLVLVNEAVSLNAGEDSNNDVIYDMAFLIEDLEDMAFELRNDGNLLQKLTRPERRNVGKCYSRWDCGSSCYCASNNYCCCPWHRWC